MHDKLPSVGASMSLYRPESAGNAIDCGYSQLGGTRFLGLLLPTPSPSSSAPAAGWRVDCAVLLLAVPALNVRTYGWLLAGCAHLAGWKVVLNRRNVRRD